MKILTSRATGTPAAFPTSARPAKVTRRLLARASAIAVGTLALATLMEPALADLPTAVQAQGAASGDYIEIAKQYFKLGLTALGLIIATFGFIAVAGGGIAKFNEYRIGRAEVGDLGVFFVLGVVILVAMVYLLNEAAIIIT